MTGLKWRLGEAEIFQIIELEDDNLIQSIIKEATHENIKQMKWLQPYFADKKGHLKALVQSFLIKYRGFNILVDTCNGNGKRRPNVPEWSNLNTNFLEKLRAVGIKEAEIDYVVCTHLHFDHVGWNTRLEKGKWVPTFPKATYLFVKKEYEYWRGKPEKELEDDILGIEDSVTPIVKTGQVQLVSDNYVITPGIRLISTPGHTPHHVSLAIESQGQKAIISGDVFHHPCQISHPEWLAEVDRFPKQTVETRYKMLNTLANNNILLIGSHFASPVAGLVKQANERFLFRVRD